MAMAELAAAARRVQFSETDAAGIVHFSYFFRYFEDAEHALWREAGLSIHPEQSPIGWPRVSASCEFHRALKFEQEFDDRGAHCAKSQAHDHATSGSHHA